MLAARRSIFVLVAMIAFVGLWLVVVPFYGPPKSARSTKTADLIRHGERARCASLIEAVWLKDPLISRRGESYFDKVKCQETGIIRWHFGWMLIWTAGVGAGLAAWLLRDRPDREGDSP